MDAAPPTIGLARASTQKLKRPARTYDNTLRRAIADGSGSPVSYTLTIADARNSLDRLAQKSGQTSAGTVSLAIRLRPATSTRALRLSVNATDAVGNAASLLKSIRLPQR